MELSDILDENIIFPKANYTSKEEVLNGLADLFKKKVISEIHKNSYKLYIIGKTKELPVLVIY
ncbi:MAG TPA: hypothetical protein VK121_04940 [Pseudogracilibacillus sp.]|nr:hypothetical protein [Pseudogracilibacillus sp.]